MVGKLDRVGDVGEEGEPAYSGGEGWYYRLKQSTMKQVTPINAK